MTTLAPSAANRRASAAPCPDAPPVRMATLPSSRPICDQFPCRCELRSRSAAGVGAAAVLGVEGGVILGADDAARERFGPEDHDLRLLVGRQVRAAVVDALRCGQPAGGGD